MAVMQAYETHNWILTASIPEDIRGGKSYVIEDTLDNRLDFLDNVRVQLELQDQAGAIGDGSITLNMANNSGALVDTQINTVLVNGTDYILNVNDVDSLADGKPSDYFRISLTPSGMAKAGAVVNYQNDAVIRVYFDAQINGNAELATNIPNQATINYTNAFGISYTDESDKPVVYTGGIKVRKVDEQDNELLLEGAIFQVYRPATEKELANDDIEKVYIEGVTDAVIPVEFCATETLNASKVSSVTSVKDENVLIYGLAYGDYYLVETKSPAGYVLLDDPLAFTIDETSHLEGNEFVVTNVKGMILPETGGMGTTMFTMTGLVLILGASIVLAGRGRKDV